MKIEFPFLWFGKKWGMLLFTIVWVLWVLVCAAAIWWDELKEVFCRWWKPQKASDAKQKATNAENRCPGEHKSLGKKLKDWYGKHKQKLAAFGAAVLYTLLLCMVKLLLPEGTAIHTTAGLLVQYSTLGVIVLILATVYGFRLKSGRESYLNILLQVGSIWTLAVVTAVFVSDTVQFGEMCNSLWCVCLSAAAFCAIQYKVKNTATVSQDDPFGPTKTFNELIGARKREAERLVDWIDENRKKNYSICVTGEWGSGKTSFINGVIDKLNSEDKKDCVIWVRALELDSLENLLQYLFGEIRRELKRRGAYVGISSEYQQFFQAVMESMTNKGASELFAARLLRHSEDYRAKQKELNRIIRQTMKDDLFLVVVDDIERCSRGKVLQFVEFIREIGTLSNCVPIFLTDYAMLQKTMGDDFDEKFFDKFFNHCIELVKVTPKEIMMELERENDEREPLAMQKAFAWPREVYKEITEKLEWKIENLEKEPPEHAKKDGNYNEYKKMLEEERCSTERALQTLKEDFSNPRAVRRFYTVLLDDWKRCFDVCLSYRVPVMVRKSNFELLRKIEIKQEFWLTAYVQVWHSAELFLLRQQGIEHYFAGGYEQSPDSNVRKLIKNISGAIFRDSKTKGEQYRRIAPLHQIDLILWGGGNPAEVDLDFVSLLSYRESAQKLQADFEAGRCEKVNQKEYIELLCYVLAEDHGAGTQDMLLKKLFAFAAQKDTQAYGKGQTGFFPEALNDQEVLYKWYEANGAYKLFYENYCQKEVPGYPLGRNQVMALETYGQQYREWVFKQLVKLLYVLAQNEQQREKLDQLETGRALISVDLRKYWDVMCEITQTAPEPPPQMELFYSAMLEQIESALVALEESGLLKNSAILEGQRRKAERGVQNLKYCRKVLEFFEGRTPPRSFESCLEESDGVEKAVDFLIEQQWPSFTRVNRQLKNLQQRCKEDGQAVSPQKLAQLEDRLVQEYEKHKGDMDDQETLYDIQVRLLDLKKQ